MTSTEQRGGQPGWPRKMATRMHIACDSTAATLQETPRRPPSTCPVGSPSWSWSL